MKMEVNLNKYQYILPLDSLDLDLLSIRSRSLSLGTNNNESVPIWTVDKKTADDDLYYEFVVYAEPVSKDVDSDCEENKNMQTCHICNAEVPIAYLKNHCNSDKHKTNLKIIENSLERLQKHTLMEMCVLNEMPASENNRFCSSCCIAVKKNDKKIHKASTLHRMNTEYDRRVKHFSNTFIHKQFSIEDIKDELSNNVIAKTNGQHKTGETALKKDELLLNSVIKTNEQSENGAINLDFVKTEHRKIQKERNDTSETSKSVASIEKTEKITVSNGNKNGGAFPCVESKETVFYNQINDDSKVDNNLKLECYLKNIKIPNVTLVACNGKNPGVTMCWNDGTKIQLTVEKFHGFHHVGSYVQCRLCRVLVIDELAHQCSSEHIQKLEIPLSDIHCIRMLDLTWHHCMLCNDYLDSKELHISGVEHVSLLKQATISQPLIVQPEIVHPELVLSDEPCKYCNIYLPRGKPGKNYRKNHNKSLYHKYNVWVSQKDSKIHHLMEKKEMSDEVNCKICKVSIVDTKERIDRHVTASDHETKYQQLLADNFVTKTDELLSNCAACNTSVLFFEEIDHIRSQKHVDHVKIKENAIEYPTEEINDKITMSKTAMANAAEVGQSKAKILENALLNVGIDKAEEQNQDETESFSAIVKKDITGPTVTADFAQCLQLDQFPETVFSEDLYYRYSCLSYPLKNGQENNIRPTPEIIKECVHYCEICEALVPKHEWWIDDHNKGKKHLSNLAKLAKASHNVQTNNVVDYNLLNGIAKQNVTVGLKAVGNNYVKAALTYKAALGVSINQPGTSKESHKINAVNIANKNGENVIKQNDANTPNVAYVANANFILRNDKEVVCGICKSNVPDTESNIDGHLNGRRHAKNYKDVMSQNKLIEKNKGSYFCEFCFKFLQKKNVLKHIESTEHQNAVDTASTGRSTPKEASSNGANQRNLNANIKNFCGICLVGDLNSDEARNMHCKSIRHKSNLTASQNESRESSIMSNKYPFKTIPGSDKLLCQICNKEVPALKTQIEKHVLNKSHSDRLLAENLNNFTCRLSKENLTNHQIYDHGNNVYYCRLCSVSLDGKWRAEVHILGQQHVKLLEKHKKTLSGQVNDNSGKIVAAKPKKEFIRETTFTDTQEASSSVLDFWYDIDDINRIREIRQNAISKTFLSAENPDKSTQSKVMASVARTIQESADLVTIPNGFKKTDNPKELFCQRCEVVVPFNHYNIEGHVNGSSHKNRLANPVHDKPPLLTKKTCVTGSSYTFMCESDNPKQVICRICSNRVANLTRDIDLHVKGMRHNEKLEEMVSSNKIVKKNDFCTCEVCIARFDEAKLLEHISSKRHIANLKKAKYDGGVVTNKKEEATISTSIVKNNKAEEDNKVHRELATTDNPFVYYCEFCQKYVSKDIVAVHIDSESHRRLVITTLSLNQIQVISNKYHCIACDTSVENSIFTHIHEPSHKMNATGVTFVGPRKTIQSLNNTESKLPKLLKETSVLKGVKLLKAIRNITTLDIKTSRMTCGICRLTDMNKEFFNYHLKSDSHIIMFETMLSANGMEATAEDDNYFCHLCKSKVESERFLDHIQSVRHDMRLVDGLNNIGKSIYSVQLATDPRIREVCDPRVSQTVLVHIRTLALSKQIVVKPTYFEIFQKYFSMKNQ